MPSLKKPHKMKDTNSNRAQVENASPNVSRAENVSSGDSFEKELKELTRYIYEAKDVFIRLKDK